MPTIEPKKTLWKSMRAGMKSSYGDIDWKIGEWQIEKGKPTRCTAGGFHASKNIVQAIGFVNCEVLALVEVAGKSDIESDKEAWQKMRIVKAYNWDKVASVKISIYAAEKCIAIYEKQYPNDDRPRKAIEAAKAWLENPTEENQSAARSAAESAAESAESAWSAAESAESAWSAAESAWSAAESAWSAAESAWSAAWSAWSAARSEKAFEQAIEETHNYIIAEIIPSLKPYDV